ncbi:MAG: alkaline phosphatase family protein [Chitinispirillia bacterium]|jgi:hypothetical protein
MKFISFLSMKFKVVRVLYMYAGIIFLFSSGISAVQKRIVVIYFIDGMELSTAKVAAENGAVNLKMMFDSGVVAEQTYTTSPAPTLELSNKSKPWGGTTSCNVAAHTGCHIFESTDMDDIFLASRDKGIKSVFSGGSNAYNVFKNADFYYSGTRSDAEVVQRGIDHFEKDNARLFRLHAQRIRDSWKGPKDRTDPNSKYIRSVINADNALGKFIKLLKQTGVWDSTFLMIAADHGMGNTSASNHPANVLSSWSPFISFYGPGIKRGKTIPYAEIPDLAILTVHLLGLRPLKGHTDPKVTVSPKGTTGTLLLNIFEDGSKSFTHPRYIEKYLKSTGMKPSRAYKDYHNGIIPFLRATTKISCPITFSKTGQTQIRPGYSLRILFNKGYPAVIKNSSEYNNVIWSLNGKRIILKNNF